jgi:hypothetical protein
MRIISSRSLRCSFESFSGGTGAAVDEDESEEEEEELVVALLSGVGFVA